jgi:hypothetical protein
MIHRSRAAVVRVRAHPKDLPISAEELAFLLCLQLLEEPDEAELLSLCSAKFTSTVNLFINCLSLPRCLLSVPSLALALGDQVPLSFPDDPPSCTHGVSLAHPSVDCP